MFLDQNLMLNLNQFTDLIYHERIHRYKANIELNHEKMTTIKNLPLRDICR